MLMLEQLLRMASCRDVSSLQLWEQSRAVRLQAFLLLLTRSQIPPRSQHCSG